MRLTFPIILMMALALLLIGSILYESGDVDNIYNLTETTMIWNFSYDEKVLTNFTDIAQINIQKVGRISNVVYRFVDFVGYSFIELGKFFIEYGYLHPEMNYELAFKLMKYYFIFLIIGVLIPLLIPLIALICIIIMGLNNLLKFFRTKRNKKLEVVG